MTVLLLGSTGASHSRDVAYDVVLLAHVLSVLIGLGAVVASGAYAVVLRRSGPGSESVRRYYRPGVNWGGRVLVLVPLFGVALVLMSQGDWSFSDGWITIGLAAWVAVAMVAEMVLWPTERRLQEAVADDRPMAAFRRPCAQMAWLSVSLVIILVAATVVMVAKP
jgi:uncharacterized membrane protein